MKYRIVYSRDKSSFANEVNQYINEGWIPQGGVAIVWKDEQTWGEPSGIYFAQAMIRELK